MRDISKKVALATLVAIAIVAAALALWKLKLVLALIFLGFILAAAMRPGIDALRRRGVPRSAGLFIHYAVTRRLHEGTDPPRSRKLEGDQARDPDRRRQASP